MELNDYIEQIKACDEAVLKEEYGIFSNFPILFKANFESVVKDFAKSGKWDVGNKEEKAYRSKVFMHFGGSPCDADLGTPIGRFLPILTGMDITGINSDVNTEKVKEYKQKQLKDYNTFLILYRSAGRPNSLRPLVNVIGWIGEYIIEEKIPACFPHSVGSNYDLRDDENLERIVYYNPE